MPLNDIESNFPVRQVLPPRDSQPAPNAHTNTTRKVSFRHPAYKDERNHNILFSIPAFDGEHGGLHHGTALLACGIIACNAWYGYLTESRAGPPIEMCMEGILSATNYWFYVPQDAPGPDISAQTRTDDAAYAYPVCPSFDHWAFPHDSEPPNWPSYSFPGETSEEIGSPVYLAPPSVSASNFSNNVLSRDRSCRVSGYRDFIEGAHLCPRSKLEWFRQNGMQLYNRNQMLQVPNQVDDIGNAVAMRADIHNAFDARIFVIVRKGGKWTNHFLSITNDLGALYHNAEITLDPGVAPAFILTRFAWALLPLISGSGFFDGEAKLVRIWNENKDKQLDKLFGVQDRERVFPQLKSKNQSPKKGKRTRSEEPDENVMSYKKYCVEVWEEEEVVADRVTNTTGLLWTNDVSGRPQLSRSVTSETTAVSSIINPSIQPVLGETITTTAECLSAKPAMNERFGASSVQTMAVSPSLTQEQKERLSEADAMACIRKEWCRLQRPTDDRLICCDYNRAELAESLGLAGLREFGGAHLCSECLGFGEDHARDERHVTE